VFGGQTELSRGTAARGKFVIFGGRENGWQGCCQPLRCYERSGRLVMAVSAAVRTSAAITAAARVSTAEAATRAIAATEAAATSEAVATASYVATAEGLEAPASIATVEMIVAAATEVIAATPAVEMVVTAAAEGAEVAASPVEVIAVTEAALVFEAVAVAPVAVTVPAAVKPGADANKHATHEIVRAPVAVRGAVIRVVIVVAVRAHRCRDVSAIYRAINWATDADANADGHLSLGVARRKQEDSKQSEVL